MALYEFTLWHWRGSLSSFGTADEFGCRNFAGNWSSAFAVKLIFLLFLQRLCARTLRRKLVCWFPVCSAWLIHNRRRFGHILLFLVELAGWGLWVDCCLLHDSGITVEAGLSTAGASVRDVVKQLLQVGITQLAMTAAPHIDARQVVHSFPSSSCCSPDEW